MPTVIPNSSDWLSTFDPYNGTVMSEGRLCEVRFPHLWDGCVGAWDHRVDPRAVDLSPFGNRLLGAPTGIVHRANGGWVTNTANYMVFEQRDCPAVLSVTLSMMMTGTATNVLVIASGVDTFNSNSWDWSCYGLSNVIYWRGNAGENGPNISAPTVGVPHRWTLLRATGQVYQDHAKVIDNAGIQGSSTTAGYTMRWGKAGANYSQSCYDDVMLHNRTLSSDELHLLHDREHVAYEAKPLPLVFDLGGGAAAAADTGMVLCL